MHVRLEVISEQFIRENLHMGNFDVAYFAGGSTLTMLRQKILIILAFRNRHLEKKDAYKVQEKYLEDYSKKKKKKIVRDARSQPIAPRPN